MKRLNLKLSRSINAQFTTDDWQLYTLPDSDSVASFLNEQLNEIVNSNEFTCEEAKAKMYVVLSNFKYFGAMDTEPIYFLEDVLNFVYQKEEETW